MCKVVKNKNNNKNNNSTKNVAAAPDPVNAAGNDRHPVAKPKPAAASAEVDQAPSQITKTIITEAVKTTTGSNENVSSSNSNKSNKSKNKKIRGSKESGTTTSAKHRRQKEQQQPPKPSNRSTYGNVDTLRAPVVLSAKRKIEGNKLPSRTDPQYLTLKDLDADWDKDNDQFSAYMKLVDSGEKHEKLSSSKKKLKHQQPKQHQSKSDSGEKAMMVMDKIMDDDVTQSTTMP